ncbi:DMT family transporter [Ensifer adhaerens]|jgi:drug/metabolite transporter (DMT)-like permease|uniref:DMT family transporter n=1 Tax=Ensifer TaxID=106591 RepID=UPI00072BB486|nr:MULTISPECIES: DMT family transporter [Ensifer]KSV68624.1 membrane protein [Sinorhizobium sp. GW3]MBD9649288.1 DMT family transporter [Ensifer sp. ENS09]MBW0365994.1 DMT family transporter [Ensifer adhaerens]NUS68625.1 DMT family transporter [Ensifer adhaerens]UCM20105.1 DMT family transporter [Ensifer adhaerens]
MTDPSATSAPFAANEKLGALLVFGSAFFWSFGGAIARFLHISDSWTIVFWRCLFAGLFLLAFMLVRDGPRGTVALFKGMGWPGIAVGLCFTIASTSFIIAISYTTIANVVLLGAGVPLFAALMSWVLFRERVSRFTWGAITAVIFGVGIMVSESLTGTMSPVGDALALLIPVVFALATVITRRYPHVRMTPATCFGCFAASGIAASQSSGLAVTGGELALLFVFGAFNLGLGMALFVTGARLVPSALAALLGTAETVLGPLWVAIIHGEVPSSRTIVGGTFILLALLAYLLNEFRRTQTIPTRPVRTPTP